jgi:penicillin-binding protein-related factor A (putative recombinase)
VIFEEQTTSSSQLDAIYQGIIATVIANPNLKDINGANTCDYFGSFYGRTISFDLAATERNGVSVNSMKIDVPCLVRDT